MKPEKDENVVESWDGSGTVRSFTPRGKSPLQKKSAFTKSKTHFEILEAPTDKGYGDDRKRYPRQGASTRPGHHTAIEIENSASNTSRMKFSRKRKPISDDEESVGNLENRMTSATDKHETVVGTPEVIKINSALLLAEEASQILGSTSMTQNGSKNFWACTTFNSPTNWTEEDWKLWKELTFFPSSTPDNKPEVDDEEANIPGEEGIFVEEPQNIGNTNWNRLYWRLLKQNSKYFKRVLPSFWFRSDGKIFCNPDPYRKKAVQLLDVSQFQKEMTEKELIFIPSKLESLEENRRGIIDSVGLELDLGIVYFNHHPYFSKEHVIASILQMAFEKYSKRYKERVTERAINKLRALRQAVSHTKSLIKKLSEKTVNENSNKAESKDALFQQRKRLQSYRAEMRKCSLSRDQGYWDDKASLAAVLDTWKELKTIREHQGYTNTSLKLNIIELSSDPKEELEKWVYDIEQDLQDLEEESQELFENEMAKYRVRMKRLSNKPSKAKKDSGEGTDDSDISQSKRRPRLPQKPNVSEFKKSVEKRYKETRRRPGEPNLVLELTNTAAITPLNQLPEGATKEKQRREAMKHCKVILHLWLGNEIYVSKPRNLSPDFSVYLGFKVPIQVTERPDVLEIDLVETGTKIRTLKMPIPIPNKGQTIDRCSMANLIFFAEDVIRVGNAGVSSGVAFEINGKEFPPTHTKGIITMRCGWVVDEDGNLNENDAQKSEYQNYPRRISNDSICDPNDPKNANREFKHSSAIPEDSLAVIADDNESESNFYQDKFELDGLMKEFEFCHISKIEESARFRLLKLRDHGVAEFRNMKMISAMQKDITNDIFNDYEKRLKENSQKKTGDKPFPAFGRRQKTESESVYESNRLEKIKEIRLSVLQLFEKSIKQITFEDLVIEEQMPDIGTLGVNLMQFFHPRRPLRPIRKERKRIQASNLVDTKVDLIFNIVRAFNLPLRKDSDVENITTESITGVQLQKKRSERGNYSSVRPFVEVWFQRKKVRTTTALGSNPTWNQELQLNLTVPNDDYSQSNLTKMDDMIFLLIYDEVSVNLLEDDRRRETDIHQRIERHWLGMISIPFSTLYSNGRIEGTFKLNTPPVLHGYEPQGMTSQFGTMGLPSKGTMSGTSLVVSGNKGAFNPQMNAFVTIFITLQPAMQPTVSMKEDNATGESTEMMAFVKNWKNLFQQQFPDRCVRPFVMTAVGETILCTRYLTPIEPPEMFVHEDGNDLYRTMEMLLHYVSLFPFVRDSTLGITDYSLWFTSDVFISTPGGGMDDHTVLLACFFLYLNVSCWIVQGNSIPNGPTTFVVTSFKSVSEGKGIPKHLKNATLLWNAYTGEVFNSNDSFCPLQKVWCVIGKKNIWANIFEAERPYQIDWNITKSKFWLPLFSKPMAEEKIPCVQNPIKRYKDSDQTQANSLAQRIERNLKDSFMKWRPSSKTNWNRYCSAILRRLLPKLEESKSSRIENHDHSAGIGSFESGMGSHYCNEEHLTELREVMTSYQMSGFPLQQPYVNMNSIVEAVYATGVHTIDTPDVEFAIAAFCQAYPSSVYSVWVYLAALHSRRK